MNGQLLVDYLESRVSLLKEALNHSKREGNTVLQLETLARLHEIEELLLQIDLKFFQ